MGKIILVPFDGTKNSVFALQEAIQMAKLYGDEIRLLNIQLTLKELGLATMEEGKKIVENGGVAFTAKIRTGIPAIEIVTEANDPAVRFVVMSIGKGKKEDIGSVSRRVLELTQRPVILIP